MSFEKRLLVLPLWFLLAAVPAGAIFGFGITLLSSLGVRNADSGWLAAAALAVLPFSYLFYLWLVAPFRMEPARRLRRAFLAVPLIAGAWMAFLFGVVYAYCGITGSGFH